MICCLRKELAQERSLKYMVNVITLFEHTKIRKQIHN